MGTVFKRSVGSLFIRNVPTGLRNNFKAACARRNKTMKQVFFQFMREYAADDTKVVPVKKSRKEIKTEEDKIINKAVRIRNRRWNLEKLEKRK